MSVAGAGPHEGTPLVSAADVAKHASLDDLWLVVDGTVYDMTRFAPDHPGGAAVLLQHAGRDASAAYSEIHAASLIRTSLDPNDVIGVLDPASVTAEWAKPLAATAATTTTTTAAGAAGAGGKPPLDDLINAHDFELAAQQSFTPKAWAFVSSAATGCVTKGWNASRWSEIGLRPRLLRDVSRVDLSTTMLGHRARSPIFCAPTSMGKMIHREGERELGRACQRLGIPQCVSTSCSYPLPEVMDAVDDEARAMRAEVAAEAGGAGDDDGNLHIDIPVFFQLYMDKDRSKSRRLLQQVRARGVKAIFLTIDAPVIGKREADERVKADSSLKLPMTGMSAQNDRKGGGMGRLVGAFVDSSMTWDAVRWLRDEVPGMPIVLKGIQTYMDARLALDAGVDAIYITNHGGRSLDTAPSTILVLLELQKNCPEVFDRMEVYVDGGVSRGTDIFKALCLGAKAVGIGRGFLFALGYGREGIEHFVGILNDELETTMQQCGVTSLDQVHPGLLNTGLVDHLIPSSEEHPYARWRPKSRL